MYTFTYITESSSVLHYATTMMLRIILIHTNFTAPPNSKVNKTIFILQLINNFMIFSLKPCLFLKLKVGSQPMAQICFSPI